MRLILALLLLTAGSLSAATLTVTNVNDSGTGSLRDMITQANASAADDTIQFAGGVTGTITLASTLPQIAQAGGVCTITGPGRVLLTISGNNLVRIFDTGLAAWLNVSRLTMQNGYAPLTGSDANGGAIYSRGTLVLYDVLINNCGAAGANSGTGGGGNGAGGAIYHTPAIANCSVTNSSITNCFAQGGDSTNGAGGVGYGGGIYAAFGSLTLTQTTFSGCDGTGGSGTTSGGTGAGGAVFTYVITSGLDCVVNSCIAQGGNGGSSFRGAAYGGGFYAEESLSLTNVTIENCQAIGSATGTTADVANGGGIAIFDLGGTPTLTISNSVIDSCSATTVAAGIADGGGLYVSMQATITDTRITNCSAVEGATAVPGGGGMYYNSAETLSIQRSTFDTNTGGGLYVGASTSASLINNTISGNSGAAGLVISGAIVTLSFNTITANTSVGGVQVLSGSATLIGSIVAANSPTQDIAGTASNGGSNLIGIQDAAMNFVNNSNGCKVGTVGSPLSPVLGPLQNNGGKTPTHALLLLSPARDSGGSVGVPTTDQREAQRDQGIADMGSYEYGATPPNLGGPAGGEGDAACSAGEGASWLWILLALGLISTVWYRRRLA
jgi:hypothetical protein